MCQHGIDRRDNILAKIMGNVDTDTESGCWEWQGPTSGDGRGGGYGRMSLNGQTVAVHRVVYTHYFGFIPGKKHIDHRCRNRRCCNPLHLELVSAKENAKRRSKANGRQFRS